MTMERPDPAQVKVQYSNDRFTSFFIETYTVVSGEYNIHNLITEVIGRCSTLSHLDKDTIRLRYRDDEGSYINLSIYDAMSIDDMWKSAVQVPGKDFKRISLKAEEMSSPGFPTVRKSRSCDVVDSKSREGAFIAADISPSSSVEFPVARLMPRRSARETKSPFDSKTRQRSLQPVAGPSFPSKRRLMYAGRSVLDASSSSESDTEDLFSNTSAIKSLKSPVERFFERKEKEVIEKENIVKERQHAVSKYKSKRQRKANVNYDHPACSACHRREGHNRSNCPYKPVSCQSAKLCGDIDRHHSEKDKLNELETALRSAQKELKRAKMHLNPKKNTERKRWWKK